MDMVWIEQPRLYTEWRPSAGLKIVKVSKLFAPCKQTDVKNVEQKVLNVRMKLISYSARQIDAVTGFIILGSASGVGRSASGVAYVSTPLFMSQEIFRTIGHETAKSTVDGMLKVESCTNEYPGRTLNMFGIGRKRIERGDYSILFLMFPHYTQRMLTVCVRMF